MEDYDEYSSDDSDDSIFEDVYIIHKEIIHVKDKREPLSKYETIEKASRFIFAEDLVSYISLKFHGKVYTTKVNKFSEKVTFPYPFNEIVKNAVQLIRWQITETKCSSFEVIEKLIKSCKLYYGCFVDAILCHYSEKGLTTGMFLYFCVYFAELASKCYTPDLEEILDFAVYAILDAFCVFKEGTDELNKFANAVVYNLKDYHLLPSCNTCITSEILLKHRLDNISKKEFIENNFSVLESDLEKSLSALELNLTGKPNKSEILSNLEYDIHNIERLTKSMTLDFVGNDIFCFMAKDFIEPINKEPNSTRSQTSSANSQNFQNFVQEFMIIVNSEVSLFSGCSSSTNRGSNDEEHSINEEGNIESIEHSNTPKKKVKISGIMSKQLASGTFSQSKAETLEQKENKRKCDNINDTLNCKEAKCLKTSSNVVQDQLSTKKLKDNKKNPSEKLIQPKNASSSKDYSSEKLIQPKNASSSKDYPSKKLIQPKNASSSKDYPSEKLIQPKNASSSKDSKLRSDPTISTSVSFKILQVAGQVKQVVVIYKREGKVNEENVRTLTGDSLLFARDLIRYVSSTFYGISYSESKFEEYRCFLSNQFSEIVKEITNIVHETNEAVNGVVYDLMMKIEKEHRPDCYRKYVEAVLSRYTNGSLNSDAFLYYCLHFSELACKIYAHENPEILDFAVCSILDAFYCLTDNWNKFNERVENLRKCYKSGNFLLYNNYYHVDIFEIECIDTIVGSLKAITRFSTELVLMELFRKEVK